MLFPETGYSLFDRDSPIVADWPQQQQLLRDIESLTLSKAAWQQEDEGTAAFHTMLCYTNSLGTSRDYVKAAEFLQLAQREGHPIARILGSRLIDAFSGTPSGHSESYWQCLTAGFVLAEKSDTPPVTDAADPCLRDFSDYRRLREYCLCRILPNVAPNGIVPQHPVVLGDEERDFLGHAIQNGDPELVARILQAGGPPGYAMSSRVQIACIHAARLGQVVVLEKILQSVYPDVQRVSYVLHWLFSVPGAKMDAIASTLTRSIGEESDAVNYAKSWGVQLHTQWPFRIREIPLTTAIASGSLQAVRTLLKLGADPLISITRTINTKRPPRWTPIHLAVRYHQPDILIALLEKPIRNEDPRVDIQRGLTPWPFACALSGTSIAERLAIHGSAYLANLKRTIALFSGEALSHRSADGTTALSQAIDHEDVDVVRQLLEYHPRLAWGKLWVPRKSSYTYPLHVACQMGSNRDTKEALEIVSIIVGHNPDGVSQQDSSGYHPLHLAAMGISTQIMELLIRHGASIHAEDKAGRTPLFLCRDAPCVNLLVNSGADVNHADDQDICPLQEVSSQGAEGAVQELILAGAKLDVGKNKAGTPLHFAVRRGAFETIQHLLTAGAETDPFDAEHRTPLSLAMDTKRADVVSVLLRNRANAFFWDCGGITPFHKLLRTDNPNFLREFQKHRCSVSVPRVMETSILQFALGRRDEGATRIAMDFMGLPCYVTQDGSAGNATGGTTSLEKAAMAFRHDIVDALLSNNPAIYGRDSQLKAAIQLVCSAGKQRDPQVEDARLQTMERLLNAGVTIIKAGESGSTVGHIALREDDPGLMMVFARHWERSTKSSKADPPSEPQWYKRFTEFFLGRTEAPSVPARGPHQQRDIVLHILPVEGRLG
jgi:ankyrin repeat protein